VTVVSNVVRKNPRIHGSDGTQLILALRYVKLFYLVSNIITWVLISFQFKTKIHPGFANDGGKQRKRASPRHGQGGRYRFGFQRWSNTVPGRRKWFIGGDAFSLKNCEKRKFVSQVVLKTRPTGTN